MPETTDTPELSACGAENYPTTLRLTIGSFNQMFDDVGEQLERDGPADEAVRSFERVADLRTLLTDCRLDVMKTIMTDEPESISALADLLGRNYADVHADVQVLADHHIVYFDSDGRAKRPVIPYDRVALDIEIVADTNNERAHA